MKLKLWEFRFASCYLGGKAIIIAESKERALELLNEIHPKPLELKHITWYEHAMDCELIPYYDDGDY